MSKQTLGRALTFSIVASFFWGAGYDFFSSQGMSYPGYVALGILTAAAILWITEAVPLFVTSLIVLFLSITWLLPCMKEAGIESQRSDFLSPFFSDVIVLFLGGFAISSAMHKRQLDEALAAMIISKTGSTFPRLLLGVMAVTAVLSMWLSNTATAAMMLALVLPIAGRMESDDLRAKSILLSVPFAANIGGLGTPIGSPPNAIAMQYMTAADIAPSFAQWMLIGVPGVIGMLAIAWGLLLVLFPSDHEDVPSSESTIRIQFDLPFWIIVVTVAITVLGWMTTSFHGQSSGTVALIPVIVFFASSVLETRDLRHMSWEVLIMMGGGLCLGTAISSSGLASWLVDLLPVDGLGSFWLTILFGGVACFMSSLMSNTATANLILPIIIGLSVDTVSPMMIGTAFGCSLAMPLPVSTPPNAMAFSSGQINVADMVRPGLILTVTGILLAFTTGYWWWDLMGIW
ncbi:MAG: DASS family sodium-coupled anion symporter [Planctomycetota bacterium]